MNANTGEFAWQIPFGITEDLRAGKGRTPDDREGLPDRRRLPVDWCLPGIVNDNRFRAIDSKTGKELWSAKLDATANADPMTYEGKDGKQYVAIVSGMTLNVFALP